MRKSVYILGLGLAVSIILSCGKRNKDDNLCLPIDTFADGDLAFRRGAGLLSRVVVTADQGGMYSHVGILKRRGNEWYVIHAVPDEPDFEGDADRVKVEPANRFFGPDRAVCGAVMRFKGDSSIARRAAQAAWHIGSQKLRFDHHYNLEDTTEMYCTELVNHVYRKAGTDLSEGRISYIDVPAFSGSYLLPSDIADNRQLEIIFQFVR